MSLHTLFFLWWLLNCISTSLDYIYVQWLSILAYNSYLCIYLWLFDRSLWIRLIIYVKCMQCITFFMFLLSIYCVVIRCRLLWAIHMSSDYHTSIIHAVCMILLTGVGSCGLCLCPVIVIHQHFSKGYAFPMGMYMLMSNIGGVVGAPLLEVLSTYYGWRGALVIVSAVVMNTVACGFIYREACPAEDDEAKPLCPKSSNSIRRNLTICKPSDTCLTQVW